MTRSISFVTAAVCLSAATAATAARPATASATSFAGTTTKVAASDPGDSTWGISRAQVIANAKLWNPGTPNRISYSQNKTHEGHRTDCSGYVAMALGLPRRGMSDPNTQALASTRYSRRINMDQLLQGDLVIDAAGTNTTRHVVIFDRWANAQHTRYWAYEQRGKYGTDHRILDYGVRGGEYKAYRPHVVAAGTPKRDHFSYEANGLRMNVSSDSGSDGAAIIAWRSGGAATANEKFWWGELKPGGWRMLHAGHSGKCVGVDKNLLVQWACTGTDDQYWRRIDRGAGTGSSRKVILTNKKTDGHIDGMTKGLRQLRTSKSWARVLTEWWQPA